jgi:glycosyltransferase involved in cell wall biosynthesis
MQKTSSEARPLLTVVVPVYNEEDVLHECQRRLSAVLRSLPLEYEIVYVDDGSRDKSVEILRTLALDDPHVAVVELSRNFGKEIASTAGFDHAQGDAVVLIDADLQDPPELIGEFVQCWQKGYDVVYGTRIAREGETPVKKVTAHLFYRFMRQATRINMPQDTGDFRLLSRRAVDALTRLREQHRFMKGLFAWIGFPQIGVPYRRDPRFAGQTKWNYWRLWNFAIEGITSFTIAPLKLATYVGLATALFAFSYGAIIILRTLVYGNPVPGYPSLMVVILFLGGIQLLALGIIGEYLGRTFNEAKRRPLYVAQAYRPARPGLTADNLAKGSPVQALTEAKRAG